MRVAVLLYFLSAACLSAGTTDLAQALVDLGSDKFAVREAAVGRLITQAESDYDAVLRECLRFYTQTKDPEVKWRLRSVMEQVVDKYLYRAPRGFLGVQMGNVGGGGIIVGQGGALVVQGGLVNLGAINLQGGGKVVVNNVTITQNSGIWVTGLVSNSAAEQAGIQANDFIVAVDGQELRGTNFVNYIQAKRPGTPVKLDVARGEKTNQTEVVLGELPQETRDKILTEEGGREFFKTWLRNHTGNTSPPAGK